MAVVDVALVKAIPLTASVPVAAVAVKLPIILLYTLLPVTAVPKVPKYIPVTKPAVVKVELLDKSNTLFL